MFEELDDIPWDRLTHAYGNAGDVPGFLRGLQDGSEETRMEALSSLFSNILHQGTVYEATSFAVPFLVEIVCDSTTRGAVLSLLQEIASGWLHCQEYAATARPVAPDVAERWARERVHYQAAHEAVARTRLHLLPLLGDPVPDVRIGAAFVLSALPGERAEGAAALLEAIDQETHDSSRAGLIFALFELTQRAAPDRVTATVSRRFQEILRSDGDGPDSRLAAGIALMRLGDSDAIDETLALARPRLVVDRDHFLRLPWEKTMELFSLIEGSLTSWTDLQIAWIAEGLRSSDPDLVDRAISSAVRLCERRRWGPSRMAPLLFKVAEGFGGTIQDRAVIGLRSLGRVGIEHLERLHGRSSELDRKIAASLDRVRTDHTFRAGRWTTKLATALFRRFRH